MLENISYAMSRARFYMQLHKSLIGKSIFIILYLKEIEMVILIQVIQFHVTAFLGDTLIFWSFKRSTISKSSIETKYKRDFYVLETCWLWNLLLELHLPLSHTPIVYCDNVNATYIHIEMSFHFICEKLEESEVVLLYVPPLY